MLDRDAGLERQIGLAHGAAGAPAAQEIADGIGGSGACCPPGDYANDAPGCKPKFGTYRSGKTGRTLFK